MKVLDYSKKTNLPNAKIFAPLERKNGKKFYQIFCDLIKNFQFKKIYKFLDWLIQSFKKKTSKSKIKEIFQLKKYIKNNVIDENYDKEKGYIGGNAES